MDRGKHVPLIPQGVCPKCQRSKCDRVTRESLRESINCTRHGKASTVVEEKGTGLYQPENNVDSLNRGFHHASGLDMMSLEVRDRNFREFTHNIQDSTGCMFAVVDCKRDICDWFGTWDLSMTESQCPKSDDPDCRHLLSDICSHTPVHTISCLKKNAFMTPVTHLVNHQQQRGLFTRQKLSEMQWNYVMKAGVMSLVRAYSWHSQNTSSTAPPLDRSRTAYYDILQVSPNARKVRLKRRITNSRSCTTGQELGKRGGNAALLRNQRGLHSTG